MAEIVIDMDRCTGHGRCYVIAPELFADDDEGRPILLVSEVDGSQKGRAIEAIEACPEAAITLKEK